MQKKYNYLILSILCSILISCASMDKELRTAAGSGDLSALKALIVSGVDVNSKGNDGETALMQASSLGHIEIVDALIISGADVNAENNHGGTSLMYASAFGGHHEIVSALIDAGANVNAKTINSLTSLMIASQKGYKLVVKRLLESGAEIDAKDRDGSTALMKASFKSYSEIVRVLLVAGADVNAKNDDDWTALMFASEKNCSMIFDELLYAGADVNAKNINGETVSDIVNHKEEKEDTLITDTLFLFSGNEPAILIPGYDIEILKVDEQMVKISPYGSSKYDYSSVALESGRHRVIANARGWDEGSIFFLDAIFVGGRSYSLQIEIAAIKFSFRAILDVWIEDMVTGERVSTQYRKNL